MTEESGSSLCVPDGRSGRLDSASGPGLHRPPQRGEPETKTARLSPNAQLCSTTLLLYTFPFPGVGGRASKNNFTPGSGRVTARTEGKSSLSWDNNVWRFNRLSGSIPLRYISRMNAIKSEKGLE